MARWGLLPKESQDTSRTVITPISLEAESVATKSQFSPLIRFRRCVIPADGYFEWRTLGEKLYPWFIRLAGGGPMALAGLWDSSVAGSVNAGTGGRRPRRSDAPLSVLYAPLGDQSPDK